MRVLALESSCDESAAAVLDQHAGLMSHELYSQVELHRAYGGVVPELASRDHVRRLLPLVHRALQRAATLPADLAGVAYTAGPGLIGALLTGAALARSLAYAWGVPAIGVHHLEGHLLAPLLDGERAPVGSNKGGVPSTQAGATRPVTGRRRRRRAQVPASRGGPPGQLLRAASAGRARSTSVIRWLRSGPGIGGR